MTAALVKPKKELRKKVNLMKLRSNSLTTIEKHAAVSGSRRGFGTGKGGKPPMVDPINAKARRLINAVECSIEQSLPQLEILRRLAAVALTDEEVFKRAMKFAKPYTNYKPVARSLVRPELYAEPTKRDWRRYFKLVSPRNANAKYAARYIEDLKRTNPDQYRAHRWDIVWSKLTEAEFDLVVALQYRAAFELLKRLAGVHVGRDWLVLRD